MSVNTKIVKSVRNTMGLLKSFVIESNDSILQDFCNLITVDCEKSGLVDLDEGKMDVGIELHSICFKKITGRPQLPLNLRVDEYGKPKLSFEEIPGMDDQEFMKIMGMVETVEEYSLDTGLYEAFVEAAYQTIRSGFEQQNIRHKNYRIQVTRMAGIVRQINFRPESTLLSEYLSKISVRLDLSNYIDLQNMPKKGSKLEAAKAERKEELVGMGMTEEQIREELESVSVIDPQYDLMLELYYNFSGTKVMPLGMYTVPNDAIKFSNGTDTNLYQEDFLNTLHIIQKELPGFKAELNKEVLEVLEYLGIDKLDNSALALGLEEPWAQTEKSPVDEVNTKTRKGKKVKA